MVYNEQLTNRIREALAHLPKVEEKKMFRGVTFMVNGKMCISAGNDEMMCRIDPDKFEAVLEKPGCRPMVHGGRTMKGFVFVNEESIRSKREFIYWVDLALDFNKKAKISTKKKVSTARKRRPKMGKM
ncbi:MAG TPA: TfoX/Sxy family protein [Cyclobacteriaceae bacterium]|jgi:TfoX/Sxy family transcriptional regulator of competence genes|nr:TfoX/Sxy family protein [Cyclobacteriaceae bacterium]